MTSRRSSGFYLVVATSRPEGLHRSNPSFLSSARRRLQPGHTAVDRLDGRKCIGLAGGFVGAVSLHACKPQREPSGILCAFLNLVERNLDYELRPHVDDV